MNLTANTGESRSRGTAFLILLDVYQPDILTAFFVEKVLTMRMHLDQWFSRQYGTAAGWEEELAANELSSRSQDSQSRPSLIGLTLSQCEE